MAKLPRGWARLRVVGEVEPIDLLVHKETGRFGILAQHDDAKVQEFVSMAEAEAEIKRINSADALDAYVVEDQTRYSHNAPYMSLKKVRVRNTSRGWAYTNGQLVPFHTTLFNPSPEELEAFERQRASYEQARQAMTSAVDAGWNILKASIVK